MADILQAEVIIFETLACHISIAISDMDRDLHIVLCRYNAIYIFLNALFAIDTP